MEPTEPFIVEPAEDEPEWRAPTNWRDVVFMIGEADEGPEAEGE